MKRGLVLSLCALALGAFAHTANAQVAGSSVKVSLNLRYTNPAKPADGGKFYVVAQSANVGGFGGLAGLSVHISNIDIGTAVFGTPAENGYAASTRATLADNLAAAGNSPYKTTTGGFVNLVYGQDLSTVGFTPVGTVAKGTGTTGNTVTDPLRNTAWNNSTVIFSGTFGATRPAFGGTIDANVFSSATAIGQAATITKTVRGDSLVSLGLNTPANSGLFAGDTDRNGVVNLSDLGTLAGNFGTTTGATWASGDTDGNGNVNLSDLGALSGNFGASSPAPAVVAIPEPASAALLALGGLAITGVARRRVR